MHRPWLAAWMRISPTTRSTRWAAALVTYGSRPTSSPHPQMVLLLPCSMCRRYGEGGIRTLGSLLDYGALAKRCFRPLSHLTSVEGDNLWRSLPLASNYGAGCGLVPSADHRAQGQLAVSHLAWQNLRVSPRSSEIMPPPRNHIVADGRRRIIEGSERDEAARVRARLTSRAARLSQRSGALGRLVIRLRIFRFVRRHLARQAPLGGLYASSGGSLHPHQPSYL